MVSRCDGVTRGKTGLRHVLAGCWLRPGLLAALLLPPAAVLLSACARGPGGQLPGPRVLTEADAGQTVELRTGDRLQVALAGNASTGYSWAVAEFDPAVLRQMEGDPGYRVTSPGVGAGGKFTFGFDAIGKGRSPLKLDYRRPWEKDKAPARTFEVQVVVK